MAKQRKWSNQVGVLPDVPEDTTTPWYREVLTQKDARATRTMQELKDEWAVLDAAEDAAAEAASLRTITYKALELRGLEEFRKAKAVAGTDMLPGYGHRFCPN